MEKNRDTRVIAIVALIIGALALSLGFATYTLDLKYVNDPTVMAVEQPFKVGFSIKENSLNSGDIYPVTKGGAYASVAKINGSKVTNINATFNSSGQEVSYTFYAVNDWNKDAFLKSVIFESYASGSEKFKHCIPGVGTDKDLVEAACNDIEFSIKVGKDTFNSTRLVNDHILPSQMNEEITVTLTYKNNAHLADGSFEVKFGDIGLTYTSQD